MDVARENAPVSKTGMGLPVPRRKGQPRPAAIVSAGPVSGLSARRRYCDVGAPTGVAHLAVSSAILIVSDGTIDPDHEPGRLRGGFESRTICPQVRRTSLDVKTT
jgi:hypothetical protein